MGFNFRFFHSRSESTKIINRSLSTMTSYIRMVHMRVRAIATRRSMHDSSWTGPALAARIMALYKYFKTCDGPAQSLFGKEVEQEVKKIQEKGKKRGVYTRKKRLLLRSILAKMGCQKL